MALDGIILDLDGTLVDSNALHVQAWANALHRHGYHVTSDRIFKEVGKGGDMLVPDLLGEEADKKDGDALRKAQPEEFLKLSTDGVRVFPMVRELLEAFHQRGLRTILATSSGKKQLQVIESRSGLAVNELLDEIVTADDAQNSKPAPDLVAAAVKKLGLTPAQCIIIGDTPYDATAGKYAGVLCLGLTCGGNTVDSLVQAGARRVYRDAADLLSQLDDALTIASPGKVHLTQQTMETLVRAAIKQAKLGMSRGEVPIGAVIADGEGTVIARGYNEMSRTQNKVAHAEIQAFGDAAGKAPIDARDLILVSTLEPCVMCTGAAIQAAIDTVIFALRAPADRGTSRVKPPQSPETQMPRIVGDVLWKESLALFEEWLPKNPTSPSVSYVKQLVSLHKHG